MDRVEQQRRSMGAAPLSAMLLSLLFSVWIAVGGLAGGIGQTTPEFQRAAPAKAVVLQAGAGKQAQAPRAPDPSPAVPPAPLPVIAERLTYPAGAFAPGTAAPGSSTSFSPYQARAPPAR